MRSPGFRTWRASISFALKIPAEVGRLVTIPTGFRQARHAKSQTLRWPLQQAAMVVPLQLWPDNHHV
jgi:hypothetical protein